MNLFSKKIPIVLLLIIILGTFPSIYLYAKGPPDIHYVSSSGLLSVHADGVALSVLLKEISDKVSCKIIFSGDQDIIITETFSNYSLQRGVKRLAKNHSMAVIYQIDDMPGSIKTLERIKEIWLFGTIKGRESGEMDVITPQGIKKSIERPSKVLPPLPGKMPPDTEAEQKDSPPINKAYRFQFNGEGLNNQPPNDDDDDGPPI
jgi:hypothetical protein